MAPRNRIRQTATAGLGNTAGEVVELPSHTHRGEPRPTVTVGQIVDWTADGLPVVDYPDNSYGPRTARVVGELTRKALEKVAAARGEVLLLFAHGSPPEPFVVGAVQPPPGRAGEATGTVVERDGDRVVIQGEREVVLQCGEAKVVLRRDGKVIIHGRDVTSRARRRHRIKGGSVAIN